MTLSGFHEDISASCIPYRLKAIIYEREEGVVQAWARKKNGGG